MNGSGRVVRSVIAVVALGVVVVLVLSWWGDYRSPESTTSGESTSTVEATATAGDGSGADVQEGESGEEPSQGTVTVLVDGLNFRTEAATTAQLITGLDEGTKLEYLGTENGWYRVRIDELTGYVSASGQYTELED